MSVTLLGTCGDPGRGVGGDGAAECDADETAPRDAVPQLAFFVVLDDRHQRGSRDNNVQILHDLGAVGVELDRRWSREAREKEGWSQERAYLKAVCKEFHVRVSWRTKDHEEPVLAEWDPADPRQKEVLTDEDEQVEKRKRIKELNKRIWPWFTYHIRRLRKHRQSSGLDPSKDPYTGRQHEEREKKKTNIPTIFSILGLDWASALRESLLFLDIRVGHTFDAWDIFSLDDHPLFPSMFAQPVTALRQPVFNQEFERLFALARDVSAPSAMVTPRSPPPSLGVSARHQTSPTGSVFGSPSSPDLPGNTLPAFGPSLASADGGSAGALP
ncbi:hypothetical protein C8R43DRAFT_949925 [Mycena crocata]|nr:hypothetical protein C8R43DRAFT_949925 [Mycena crocata]